jgi:hypothetical protein
LYKPTNDLVEDNFSKESLAIVQEIAKEPSTVYKLKNLSKKEQGFIPLEQSLKYGTGTDEHQISKMRYLPGKDVRNHMWGMVWRPECWHGLIVSSSTELAEQVVLERGWVNHNIKKSMHTFLKEVREKEGHTGFVYIPEGDNEPHAPETVSFLGNSPIVEYYNMGDDQGMCQCVLDNAASGLAFLGLHRLARLISSTIGNQEGGLTNPMRFVGQVL